MRCINYLRINLVFTLICYTVSVSAQDIKQEIAQLNLKLSENLKNERIKSLMELYSDNVIYFPQYKPAITSKVTLEKFYAEWVDSSDILAYDRITKDLQIVGDKVVEVGALFILSKSYLKEMPLNCNYITIWERANNSYKIEADAFVSDSYITVDQVPYHFVSIEMMEPTYILQLNNKIDKEVFEQNKSVIEAVEKGDTESRINGFHPAAILISNFSNIKNGKDEIVPYLKKIYYPGSNLYTDHSYYDIRKLDNDHILVLGHFKGGWNRPSDSGTF